MSGMTSPPRQELSHSIGLRIIAVYKAVKSLSLLLVAAVAFHLDREQNLDQLVLWLEHLSLADSNGLRWKLVDILMGLGHRKFVAIGMVAIGYAAIFATEGIGLWLGKYWAQWFTVIATGSLIPLELYEIVHRFSAFKLIALLANVAIVAYLVRVVLQERTAPTRQPDQNRT